MATIPKVKIQSSYYHKNIVLGVALLNNQKVFYKFGENLQNEITGYQKVKDFYDVPKLIFQNRGTLIYEYKEELMTNTLHEYFYFNKKACISKVLEALKKPYSTLQRKKEELLENQKFFKGRTNLLLQYLKDLTLPKELKDILKEIIRILNKPKTLSSIISLGDPTDTNISSFGLFTDFENAGFNSVVGEIAILFSSVITHGGYFYPKYNQDAYFLRSKILNCYQQYKPNLFFDIPIKKKEFLLAYLTFLNQLKEIREDANKYLKYYLCMRILSPISLFLMSYEDYNLALFYVYYIYHNVNSLSDLIKLVKEEI